MLELKNILEQGEFLVEELVPSFESLRVNIKGETTYFTIAKGTVHKYRVATFLCTGVVIHLEEINEEDDIIVHLRKEVKKWDVKESCSVCGYRTHPRNLIYHDNGESLCEDCFVEHAMAEFENNIDDFR